MSGGLFSMLVGGPKGAEVAAPKGATWTGPEGIDRFAIDDTNARLDTLRPGTYRLDTILSHPELFQRYPQLAGINVYVYDQPPPKGADLQAWYIAADNSIGVNLKAFPRNVKARDILPEVLHELQHAIQKVEGMSYGTTPQQVDSQLAEGTPTRELVMRHVDEFAQRHYSAPYASLNDEQKKRVERLTAYDLQYGELEANAVGEARRKGKADPRPFIKREEAIIRKPGSEEATAAKVSAAGPFGPAANRWLGMQ